MPGCSFLFLRSLGHTVRLLLPVMQKGPLAGPQHPKLLVPPGPVNIPGLHICAPLSELENGSVPGPRPRGIGPQHPAGGCWQGMHPTLGTGLCELALDCASEGNTKKGKYLHTLHLNLLPPNPTCCGNVQLVSLLRVMPTTLVSPHSISALLLPSESRSG